MCSPSWLTAIGAGACGARAGTDPHSSRDRDIRPIPDIPPGRYHRSMRKPPRVTQAVVWVLLVSASLGPQAQAGPRVSRAGMQTSLASITTQGSQANGDSNFSSLSADGRFLVFESVASNLAPGDTNNTYDVFVRDMKLGTTRLASVGMSGLPGNVGGMMASISGDGRYVAFGSDSTDLVPNGVNGSFDVFVRDMSLGTTRLVAPHAYWPAISASGRFVAYWSPDSAFHQWEVFVTDLRRSMTEMVSVGPDGERGNADSGIPQFPAISARGRYVAFPTLASNFVPGDTDGSLDVFVRDRRLARTVLVSATQDGAPGNASSAYPSITGNGRYVAFWSGATNLVPPYTSAHQGIFVRDLRLGATSRVDVGIGGSEPNGWPSTPFISSRGRFVVYSSEASNLVAGDRNGTRDVFEADLRSGRTIRVTLGWDGSEANGTCVASGVSARGRRISFWSYATNLVQSDTNGHWDEFVAQVGPGA